MFFGRTDAKAESPILWPPHAKSWLIGKDSDAGRDWGQEEKGMTEDEMAGWHHRLVGHEFGWTPGVGDGQGGLACCNSWDCKELDMTERLNWTEVSSNHNYHWKKSGSVSRAVVFDFLWPHGLIRGILQARILEWVAFPFSRVSSQPRDWTQVSRVAGGIFTTWTTREAHNYHWGRANNFYLVFIFLKDIGLRCYLVELKLRMTEKQEK